MGRCGKALSIRKQVFDLLNENPLLSTKHICKLLNIHYNKRKSLIYKYRSHWRSSLHKQIRSKCQKPAFHKPSAWVYVDKLGLKVSDAIERGWIQTRAKNRYLLWRDPGYGHMKWFPTTGRVNIHTKKPHLRGRLFQLFCNGFSMTGLIDSMAVLNKLLKSIRLKAASAVFGSPERLPYMEIKMFKLSNGVIIKMGDRSHPHAIEIEFCYPDWAEKNERLLGELTRMLMGEPRKPKKLDDDKGSPFYVS